MGPLPTGSDMWPLMVRSKHSANIFVWKNQRRLRWGAAVSIFLGFSLWRLHQISAYHLVSTLHAVSDAPVSIPTLFSKGSACNPYDQPGYLQTEPDDLFATRWTPIGRQSCHAEPLLPAFLGRNRQTGFVDQQRKMKYRADAAHASNARRSFEDVKWAVNKTVLVLGDPIQRDNVWTFCQLAEVSPVELIFEHPWSPPPSSISVYVDEELDDQELVKQAKHSSADSQLGLDLKDYPKESGIPYSSFYCHVPGVNFLIMSVSTFGMDETQLWLEEENPPYSFENRVARLAKPYIERAKTLSGRESTAPELIYVTSTMWDLAKFGQEDRETGTYAPFIDTSRLEWYRNRVRDVLLDTARQFPTSSLKWVTTHYPTGVKPGAFVEKLGSELDDGWRSLYRLKSMDSAAKSAVLDHDDLNSHQTNLMNRVGINRWGELLLGIEEKSANKSEIPGWNTASHLWAEMMLNDLRATM